MVDGIFLGIVWELPFGAIVGDMVGIFSQGVAGWLLTG